MKENHVHTGPAKPVGIWIRVSTEDQAKGDSPQHHEARAREYAKWNEWDVKEVYNLAGVSGKTVMEHPECKRMLEDIKRGHITGLIFSKLARLARNKDELEKFAKMFRGSDADMISLQEKIDTSTPAGRFFYSMIAAMAEWEREEIADRVNASIRVRAQLGKPLNGKSPYGYHWKDKALHIHPEEGPVRRLMYELFAKHGRKKTVARVLNERGFRTRDGSKWSDTSVGRLIQDTTAKGIHRANFTRRVADNKPWAFKPEHDWILTPVEPLISEELWQTCNDSLEARKTKLARPTRRVAHLFAGLTFCECGKKMYVPSNSPKYVCTGCKNKIPIVDLEAVFIDELKNYLLSPDKVSAYLKGANATIGEKTQLLETLQGELQKVKEKADQTYQLYLQHGLTVEQFKELFQPLDARKKQIEADIPRVEAEADMLAVDSLSSEQIMAQARDLHSRWPKMNHDERRKMIEIIVKSIVIGNGEITLNLCYLPTFEQMTTGQRIL